MAMGFIVSFLLASAATSPLAYPTTDVLNELKATCFNDYRSAKRQGFIGEVSDTVEFWLDKARRRGWAEITDMGETTARDRKVRHLMKSLDYSLFGSFSENWSTAEDKAVMLGGQVFKKSISGRIVYLSVFGAEDGSGRIVGECRIHDPLGDGVNKNPVNTHDIQDIVGARVRKLSGPFSSNRYRWTPERGQIAQLDVHFGFKGWRLTPFDRKIEQFDPYAPYGLTLVAGFHEQDIII
jgi:hypothetical protein